jgi:hypothetical protein
MENDPDLSKYREWPDSTPLLKVHICTAEPHQRAAMPLHRTIVLIFGLLALACIGGGIVGIIYSATSETKLDIFGVHLSTGHVGVAFVGLGLIIGYFTVRSVLRSQYMLAALRPDHPAPRYTNKRRKRGRH